MKNQILFLFALTMLASCGDYTDNSNSTDQDTISIDDKFSGLLEQANTLFGQLKTPSDTEISKELTALGKALYFDKNLSKDNTQSCNTCHNLSTYGVDNNSFSKGNDGGLGGRNSPTTFNAALHIAQFWDGREPDVESQAGGPILNPVEMAMPSEEAVINRLSSITKYNELFKSAFPEEANPVSYENLKTAIGAFERQLITLSKFDEFLAGDVSVLSDKEKEGLQTFISTGCITCHSGKLIGGNMFQKFGVYGNYWDYTKSEKHDEGRYEVTKDDADKFVFKVPSLRNIVMTYPYFHDGSVKDINSAVQIMAKAQLQKELSEKEIDDIVSFLSALTGEVPKKLTEEYAL